MDLINDEAFWSSLVEDSVKGKWGNVLVPIKGLSEKSAIALAVKLKVSLLTQGDSYVFSSEKEGTLVHLGSIPPRH